MERGSIEFVSPTHLGFAFHVEKAIVPYYLKEVSESFPFVAEMGRRWQRYCEQVMELE